MKAIFKFEFIGEHSLKIKLLQVCDSVLNKTETYDGNYFMGGDIMIWSLRTFAFDERQIRLPQLSKLSDKMEHTHNFKSDKERYDTLKNFYDALTKWSNGNENYFSAEKKVIIKDKYWSII